MNYPALSILVLLTAVGCSTPQKVNMDTVSPPFATAYAGGKMTISWESEVGQIYTVYYTDAPRGTRPNWQPLPTANRLTGNGQTVTLTDTPPAGATRRYLLMTGDQRP
ncbi:MAG: hypothetical protein AB7E95_13205 [Kiritimatiellales bacterium]